MAALRPAYLIHGEDHGAVGERRLRLLAMAGAEGSGSSVELLEGQRATPGGVAEALAVLRLGGEPRVIVVDGVEKWKDAEVKARLLPALRALDPDTTVAMFAREQGSSKAPPSLHRAVAEAGGQVSCEATLKPWQLPAWVQEQARRLGLALDAEAAGALVGQVGDRRQRLLRELEKIALELDGAGASGAPRPLSVEEIALRAARSAQTQAFALADALVAGSRADAVRSYLRLRAQGERLPGLQYLMASRLRQALSVASRLERGEPKAAVRRTLRMPSSAAERLTADAARAGEARLREALVVLADLELHSRGGPLVGGCDGGEAYGVHAGALDEDTLALRAIETIADGLA